MAGVVVDASTLLALALNEPARTAVLAQLAAWSREGVSLYAPTLLPDEWASGVANAIARGRFDRDQLPEAWNEFANLSLDLQDIGDGCLDAVRIALQLRRRSAYDAAYLALAQRLGVECWTLDTGLYNNANGIGLPVKLLA